MKGTGVWLLPPDLVLDAGDGARGLAAGAEGCGVGNCGSGVPVTLGQVEAQFRARKEVLAECECRRDGELVQALIRVGFRLAIGRGRLDEHLEVPAQRIRNPAAQGEVLGGRAGGLVLTGLVADEGLAAEG